MREDDPAFALVTLNELMLRKLTSEALKDVEQRIAGRLAVFDQTMQRVEQRASKALGHQVRESSAALQETVQAEIAGARMGMLQMAEEVRKANRGTIEARWYAGAALLAVVTFAFGFWVGRF